MRHIIEEKRVIRVAFIITTDAMIKKYNKIDTNSFPCDFTVKKVGGKKHDILIHCNGASRFWPE